MANTFKRYVQSSIGTALTSVGAYTVPASTQTTVVSLLVSNTSVSDVTIDVTLNNGTTDYYIVKGMPLLTGSAAFPIGLDGKIVLQTADSVKVKSSAATSVDAILSILEIA